MSKPDTKTIAQLDRMGIDFTTLFWLATIAFLVLSVFLVTGQGSRSNTLLYSQIFAGCLMFATSKIGRKFLGLE